MKRRENHHQLAESLLQRGKHAVQPDAAQHGRRPSPEAGPALKCTRKAQVRRALLRPALYCTVGMIWSGRPVQPGFLRPGDPNSAVKRKSKRANEPLARPEGTSPGGGPHRPTAAGPSGLCIYPPARRKADRGICHTVSLLAQ